MCMCVVLWLHVCLSESLELELDTQLRTDMLVLGIKPRFPANAASALNQSVIPLACLFLIQDLMYPRLA